MDTKVFHSFTENFTFDKTISDANDYDKFRRYSEANGSLISDVYSDNDLKSTSYYRRISLPDMRLRGLHMPMDHHPLTAPVLVDLPVILSGTARRQQQYPQQQQLTKRNDELQKGLATKTMSAKPSVTITTIYEQSSTPNNDEHLVQLSSASMNNCSPNDQFTRGRKSRDFNSDNSRNYGEGDFMQASSLKMDSQNYEVTKFDDDNILNNKQAVVEEDIMQLEKLIERPTPIRPPRRKSKSKSCSAYAAPNETIFHMPDKTAKLREGKDDFVGSSTIMCKKENENTFRNNSNNHSNHNKHINNDNHSNHNKLINNNNHEYTTESSKGNGSINHYNTQSNDNTDVSIMNNDVFTTINSRPRNNPLADDKNKAEQKSDDIYLEVEAITNAEGKIFRSLPRDEGNISGWGLHDDMYLHGSGDISFHCSVDSPRNTTDVLPTYQRVVSQLNESQNGYGSDQMKGEKSLKSGKTSDFSSDDLSDDDNMHRYEERHFRELYNQNADDVHSSFDQSSSLSQLSPAIVMNKAVLGHMPFSKGFNAHIDETDGLQLDGSSVEFVIYVKGPRGIEFSLDGGLGSLHGDRPIIIKRLFRGASAETRKQLKAGDEILTVNEISTKQMTRFTAWKYFKSLPCGPVTLTLRRFLK